MKKNKVLSSLWTYTLIIAVAVLLAFNYQLFIVPNKFAPAGINGIATMIQHKLGLSIGYLSLMINIPLCILSFFTVSKKYAYKAFVFCITYSMVYLYLHDVIKLEAIQYQSNGVDTIFPALISGVLSGVVYGICFRTDASAGGTDIISKVIHKYIPEFNFFWIRFFLNAIVAVASLFVYADPTSQNIINYKPVCLCLIYCFVASYFGDVMTKGVKVATKFTVITTHPDEIIEEVTKNFRHTATRIQAVGSYSNDEKTMLICVVNKHQMVEFSNMLKKYDNTFSFQETVNETYGNFKKIK